MSVRNTTKPPKVSNDNNISGPQVTPAEKETPMETMVEVTKATAQALRDAGVKVIENGRTLTITTTNGATYKASLKEGRELKGTQKKYTIEQVTAVVKQFVEETGCVSNMKYQVWQMLKREKDPKATTPAYHTIVRVCGRFPARDFLK